MKGWIMIIAGAAVALMGAWVVAGYLPVRNVETPKYEVVSRHDGYEIRQYPAHIVAEVEVSGPYQASLNQGFRKLADYIFGNNAAANSVAMTAPVLQAEQSGSAKIAMTAPVLQGKSDGPDGYTVAFIMPGSYTLDTLPKPNNPEIRLREVSPEKHAALRFKGYAPEDKVARKTARLLERLKADNVVPVGTPTVAQYHPPWTPPFMRRNEILVEVQ